MHFYLHQTELLQSADKPDRFKIFSDDEVIGDAECTVDGQINCVFFEEKIRLRYAPKDYFDAKLSEAKRKTRTILAKVLSAVSIAPFVLSILYGLFTDLLLDTFILSVISIVIAVPILWSVDRFVIPKAFKKRWYRFFQNEKRQGDIIRDFRHEVPCEFECSFDGVQYRLYHIGRGEDGVKFPLYKISCGEEHQIALAEKGTEVHYHLDEYEITAIDERAGLLATVLMLCVDRQRYPLATMTETNWDDDGFYSERKRRVTHLKRWEYPSHPKLFTKYDSTFKSRVLGRDG